MNDDNSNLTAHQERELALEERRVGIEEQRLETERDGVASSAKSARTSVMAAWMALIALGVGAFFQHQQIGQGGEEARKDRDAAAVVALADRAQLRAEFLATERRTAYQRLVATSRDLRSHVANGHRLTVEGDLPPSFDSRFVRRYFYPAQAAAVDSRLLASTTVLPYVINVGKSNRMLFDAADGLLNGDEDAPSRNAWWTCLIEVSHNATEAMISAGRWDLKADDGADTPSNPSVLGKKMIRDCVAYELR